MWGHSISLLSLVLSCLRSSEAAIVTAPTSTTSGLATITLAPRSEYTEAAPTPLSATGTNILIIPRAQQTDGLDFYVPQAISKLVDDALQKNSTCNEDCENSIAAAIKPGLQNLQPRALGIFVFIIPVIASMIAVALASSRFTESDGTKIGHLPWNDLNQASAVQASPTLVFETAVSAAIPFTVTSPIVSVPSLSQPPEPSRTDGGFPVRPPSAGASAVAELIARGGYCAGITSTSNKRDTNSRDQCFIQSAELLFDQEAPGGPLDFIFPLSKNIPLEPIPFLTPYLQSVLSYAKAHNYGVSDDNLTSISKMNLWIVYDTTTSGGRPLENWDIPRSVFLMSSSTTVSQTSSAQNPKKTKSTSSALPCPTGKDILPCDYADCYDGTNITRGIVVKGQEERLWANCTGSPREPPGYAPYASLGEFQQASDYLRSLFNPTVLLIAISGKNQPGLGIYRVQFTQEATLNGVFSLTVFNDGDQSTNQVGNSDISSPVTILNFNPGKSNLTFSFTGDWDLETSFLNFGLSDESGNVILANESSIQTSSPQAYTDSVTPWNGNTRQINTYFYTKPSLIAGKYHVHVLQQWTTWTNITGTGQIRQGSLENWSQVVLSLYDSNYNLIGGPTASGRVSSDVLDVVISVKDPLSDGSIITFMWGRMKWFSVTTDPSAPSWCQQVAMTPWTPPAAAFVIDQQGGQRQFDCWFDPRVGT